MVRMKCRLLIAIMLFLSAALSLGAQSAKCGDAAEDPHFSVLFENSRVRVLSLELGRIESTKPFTYKRPHMAVVTTESRTTSIPQGGGGITHDWYRGDIDFIYNTDCRTLRNELSTAHRQIVVETYLPVDYKSYQDYETALTDLSTVKPTTSVSFTRGGLTATRHQVASGDAADVNGGDHVLIALTDIELQTEDGKDISLGTQEVKLLSGNINKLKNTGSKQARFVIVDY